MIAEIIIAATIGYAVSSADNGKTITLSEAGGIILFDDKQSFPENFCVTIINNDNRRVETIGTRHDTYTKQLALLPPGQSFSVTKNGNSWKTANSCPM